MVAAFATSVRPIVDAVAFYAGGSLASGDFHPGVSDLDLVAVIAAELDAPRCRRLRELHTSVRRTEPSAAKLHCDYVPQHDLTDLATPHLRWAHGELYRHPLSGIARAELLQGGITVYGPPPADLVPPLDLAATQAAARAELTGYWAGATRKAHLWRQDVYVDLGLLTVARAEALLSEGRLITKAEALTRLDRFGVDPELTEEIGRRRRGETVELTTRRRMRRAYTARRLVADGIRRLR